MVYWEKKEEKEMRLIFLIGNIFFLLVNIVLFFIIKKREASIPPDSTLPPLDSSIVDMIYDEIKIKGTSRLYGGLVGKIVKKGRKEYLVLSCDVIPDMRSIKYRLRLYSYDTRSTKYILVSGLRDIDFLKKYGVLSQQPIRSRVMRRDVKNFCNNMCIQDCSECVLKKYY